MVIDLGCYNISKLYDELIVWIWSVAAFCSFYLVIRTAEDGEHDLIGKDADGVCFPFLVVHKAVA